MRSKKTDGLISVRIIWYFTAELCCLVKTTAECKLKAMLIVRDYTQCAGPSGRVI